MKHTRWQFSSQRLYVHLNPHLYACAFHRINNARMGYFGLVVFVAKMAKPHMAQVLRVVFRQELSALRVAKMTCSASYTFLKMNGIRTVGKHVRIVICLDNKIIGASYQSLHLLSNMTDVSKNGEDNALTTNLVAHIVRTANGVTWNSPTLKGTFFSIILRLCFINLHFTL